MTCWFNRIFVLLLYICINYEAPITSHPDLRRSVLRSRDTREWHVESLRSPRFCRIWAFWAEEWLVSLLLLPRNGASTSGGTFVWKLCLNLGVDPTIQLTPSYSISASPIRFAWGELIRLSVSFWKKRGSETLKFWRFPKPHLIMEFDKTCSILTINCFANFL